MIEQHTKWELAGRPVKMLARGGMAVMALAVAFLIGRRRG
jgi:hypothetical protein